MIDPIQALAARMAKPEPLRWVFAGDSITHGAFHTLGWRDYVELIGERVRWELQRRRDCLIKTGISGWTIQSLADDLQWSALQHRPDVLVMMFGMNDCVAGPAGRAAFEAMYDRVIRAAREAVGDGLLVFVQTPNRVLPNDATRHPHLAEYACGVREVAARNAAGLIDHFADWEPAEGDGSIWYRLSDAIHPNAAGHRLLARHFLRTLGAWDEKSLVGRLFTP